MNDTFLKIYEVSAAVAFIFSSWNSQNSTQKKLGHESEEARRHGVICVVPPKAKRGEI